MSSEIKKNYDLLIIGAGLGGTLLSISLLKENPKLKILIIEKEKTHFKKVGESTSDLTAIYLNRFGIDEILAKQTKKTGLRFIFQDDFEFSSPVQKSIANGYQLNREVLDKDLSEYAKSLGVEILFNTKLINLDKKMNFNIDCTLESQGDSITLNTQWVVDCSGRNRIIHKKLNWDEEKVNLKTCASWGHYTNCQKDWDQLDQAKWNEVAIGKQADATVHFLGKGYWCWFFPISDSIHSLGIVYDKSMFEESNPKKIFEKIVHENKILHKITANGTLEKFYHRDELPYLTKKIFDHGFISLGDAASFTDPLFSPGMELTVQNIENLKMLLNDYFHHDEINEARWKKYEMDFLRAYKSRLFTFEHRYKIMHHSDIFTNWCQLDFFGYFYFYVIPTAFFPKLIKTPVHFTALTSLGYKFLMGRYLSIANRKDKLNLGSYFESKNIYSELKVPANKIEIPKNGFRIFYLWFKHYLILEFNHFKSFLVKK